MKNQLKLMKTFFLLPSSLLTTVAFTQNKTPLQKKNTHTVKKTITPVRKNVSSLLKEKLVEITTYLDTALSNQSV